MSESNSDKNQGRTGGVTKGLRNAASKNPATERLLSSVEGLVGAGSEKLVSSLGERVKGTTKKLTEVAAGNAEPSSLLGKTAKNAAQGESPGKALLHSAVSGVTDKAKSVFGKGKGPGGGKSINVVEDIDVGVPIRDAYNRWTQFTDFSKWAKGVQTVNQDDPVKSNWNAKVFLSKRNWTATITDQIPDERIAWTSDGPKGTVDGVVTFHPLAEDLTKVLLVLQYRPAGLFEKTGNLWRAQGRRARLDLKLYRRFVTMAEEEAEGWRGEIRDGEVVKEHDEAVAEEENENDGMEDEDYDDEAYDEDEDEDEGDEEEEDEDEGEEYDDEEQDEEEEDEQPQPAARRRRAG